MLINVYCYQWKYLYLVSYQLRNVVLGSIFICMFIEDIKGKSCQSILQFCCTLCNKYSILTDKSLDNKYLCWNLNNCSTLKKHYIVLSIFLSCHPPPSHQPIFRFVIYFLPKEHFFHMQEFDKKTITTTKILKKH